MRRICPWRRGSRGGARRGAARAAGRSSAPTPRARARTAPAPGSPSPWAARGTPTAGKVIILLCNRDSLRVRFL